ncbi:MAG: NADH-quinone oxidoreductase subunit F, partial [Actinoallomurus sp.]
MTTLTPVLTKGWDQADSFTLAGYQRGDGYRAMRKALAGSPDDLIQLGKDSGLRGRGGAGFPAGMKWSFIPKVPGPKYVTCNTDESEPGTFKD